MLLQRAGERTSASALHRNAMRRTREKRGVKIVAARKRGAVPAEKRLSEWSNSSRTSRFCLSGTARSSDSHCVMLRMGISAWSRNARDMLQWSDGGSLHLWLLHHLWLLTSASNAAIHRSRTSGLLASTLMLWPSRCTMLNQQSPTGLLRRRRDESDDTEIAPSG